MHTNLYDAYKYLFVTYCIVLILPVLGVVVILGASDPPTFSSQFPPNMTSAQKADLGDVSTKPELTLFIYSQEELPRVY